VLLLLWLLVIFTVLDLSDDVVCTWSSRGPVVGVVPKPDFTAPGESILGPWLGDELVVSGTSMSAPLLAGGLAVAMGNNKLLLDVTGFLYFFLPGLKQGIVCGSVSDTVFGKVPVNSYGWGIPDFEQASYTIFWRCLILIIIWVLVVSAIVSVVVYVYKKSKKKEKKKVDKHHVTADW